MFLIPIWLVFTAPILELYISLQLQTRSERPELLAADLESGLKSEGNTKHYLLDQLHFGLFTWVF